MRAYTHFSVGHSYKCCFHKNKLKSLPLHLTCGPTSQGRTLLKGLVSAEWRVMESLICSTDKLVVPALHLAVRNDDNRSFLLCLLDSQIIYSSTSFVRLWSVTLWKWIELL